MAAVRAARRLAPASPQTLHNLIALHGSRTATPVTVRDLYHHGMVGRREPGIARLSSARWLHRELPIRLAHRVHELSELPLGLAEMPSVLDVKRMYERSFSEIVDLPVPTDETDEHQFASLIEAIRKRHDTVVVQVARGVLELKERFGLCSSNDQIQDFLDSFYSSRIGLRVLISHHLALGDCVGDTYGVINRKCNPSALAESAIRAAGNLAYQHFGDSVDVEICGKRDFTFPYVDTHLFLCLFELLKNSMRATIETHRDAKSLPPVRVIIADGAEDVTIKISDEGGGFPSSHLESVWTYLFTTAKLSAQELIDAENNDLHSGRPDPIAGFGYGLPLSRLYARHWGGELSITSMEGYGTDAYLHLSKLGDKQECRSGVEYVAKKQRSPPQLAAAGALGIMQHHC